MGRCRAEADFPLSSCHGLPTPQQILTQICRYCLDAQVKLSPGAVFIVDGECIASCAAYPGTEKLQAAFEGRPELVDLYGNITVSRNVLLKDALTWCSNIQSPDVQLHHKPCSASQSTTTGCNSIINGMDHRVCVEVSVSATLRGQPWLAGAWAE